MPFRVSYFFVQQTARAGGWSENFWNGASDLNVAVTKANDLGNALLAVHGHTSYITAIRYSEVGAFRRVAVAEQTMTFNPQVGNAVVSDYPTTALLLRMNSAPNYVTNQWIRGIPDSQISAGGFYVPTGTFAQAANALFGVLTTGTNQWAMRVQDKSVPKKAIFSISNTGVVTVPNHGYFDGDYIRVSRVQGFKGANGVWKIQVVDTNSFQLLFWTAPPVGTPMYGNPTAQKQIKTFISPVGAAFIRATEHKVGRPSGVLTGRRRTR